MALGRFSISSKVVFFLQFSFPFLAPPFVSCSESRKSLLRIYLHIWEMECKIYQQKSLGTKVLVNVCSKLKILLMFAIYRSPLDELIADTWPYEY